MTEREIEQASLAAGLETGCDMDMEAAKEEATWYSVLNTMALSLGSGMGVPLDQSDVDRVLDRLDVSLDGLPLKNPSLLKAFFKSGDPHLTKQFEMRNLDTWRWPSDSFDRVLLPQAQGWPAIAQAECAKWFAIPHSAGVADEELRSEWRLNGMLFWALARIQCQFAFDNLRNEKGLFVTAAQPGSVQVTEAAANLEDQACLLWAVSDLAALTGDAEAWPMYFSERGHRMCHELADDLFQAAADNKEELLKASASAVVAQSVAVQSLVWYASQTEAQDLKARALWLLREFADNLVRAEDKSEMVGDTLVDAAAALRALVEAFRVARLRTYAETAAKIFSYVESQWWKLPGTYAQVPLAGEYTYNADDVGAICGALNASRLFLGGRIDRELAELRLRLFFCNAVNVGGLQMSMPSPNFMPSWLLQREPSLHFRYGTIPLPSEAGGDFGIAPVLAGEVAYDPQSDTWSRRMIFDAPAAMHACYEFLWMNHEAVNGFPEIRLEEAPMAVRRAAGVEA